MKFNNKAKPIKFSLLVGGRECRSVEDVKRNFDYDSLNNNFANGNLQKWLKQIGESSLLKRIDDFSTADLLTIKMCIYNLFAPEPLPSDEVNEDNVLKLLKKGCIKFGDLSGTPFADNLAIKKSVIENIDNATINRWCESDLELLKYVYSKKSYANLNAKNCRRLIDEKVVASDEIFAMWKKQKIDDATLNQLCENDLELLRKCYYQDVYDILNAKNCRRMIDEKIVTNVNFIMKIATEKNLDDIKQSIIENVDNATINSWCESDLELLKYVYSKKSCDFLNATNYRTLINQKIITNEDLVMKIATEKNLDDILERFGKLSVRLDNIAIEMILVKGYSGGNFFIGKYPITQAQWQAVMGNNPSSFKGADNPVERVSWNDCQDFVKKLNSKTGRKFRLPKEAEWNYAARGGNKTHNYTYSGSDKLDEVGWFSVNSDGKTHPVGKKKSNELGIYDMSGNVLEWCEDLYSVSGTDRVNRGGCWHNGYSYCAVSYRCQSSPDNKSRDIGLRLAMDV